MKKLSLILTMLMAVMCLAMTACSGKEEPVNAGTNNGANNEITTVTTAPITTQTTPVTTEKPVAKTTLTVFAASSLTEALEEISGLFKEKYPNVTLVFNFDSSGKLQTQIENGAEADLFISAAQKQMNALEEGNLLAEGTRENFLENKVVLIVPKDVTTDISAFEDCLTDKVSLMSIGNADVPVGQYTEEIFTFLGGWDKIQAKSSMGSSVKEVLAQVETGSVDCGIVYSTDAATSTDVKVVAVAPEGSHKTVSYPGAVLKGSKNTDVAGDFLEFLNSEEATKVFEKIGFATVD